MPLQSHLFKGDPKLEACLVSDPAHVTPGCAGDHVAKIQYALFELDGAVIAAAEISGQKYGPSTAAAVLAYKRKRRIINYSYQSQADNIVGKMTIAALDREMKMNEEPEDFEDVAVCKLTDGVCESGARMILSFGITESPAPVPPWRPPNPPVPPIPPPAPAPPAGGPLAHAWAVMGTARGWVNSALGWLRTTRQAYGKFGNSNWPAQELAIFNAIDVHFHLRRLPKVDDQPGQLDKIIKHYTDALIIMRTLDMLGDDPTRYTDPNDPRFGAYATAKIGGFHETTLPKKVWFHGMFLDVPGVKCRCAMIIHECGHSAATALHYAYGHPRGSGGVPGEPQKGHRHTRNYADLTPEEALRNADTYATFAAHASTNDPSPTGDFRPGAHNLTQ